MDALAEAIRDLRASMVKGDLPGHEFRGNQWTGENAGAGDLVPALPGSAVMIPRSRKEGLEAFNRHYSLSILKLPRKQRRIARAKIEAALNSGPEAVHAAAQEFGLSKLPLAKAARQTNGHFTRWYAGAPDAAFKARAFGRDADDRRLVSARVLGIERTDAPHADAVEAGSVKQVALDKIAVGRHALVRGRIGRAYDAMKHGPVAVGEGIQPIEVAERADKPGHFVVVKGRGEHRIAALRAGGHKGDVPVMVRQTKTGSTKGQDMTTPATLNATTSRSQPVQAVAKEGHDDHATGDCEECDAAVAAMKVGKMSEADKAMMASMISDEDEEAGADAARQAGAGKNPPSWVADEDVWERAKKAASKSYDEGDEAFWPVVVHVYGMMGGTRKTEKAAGPKGSMKVVAGMMDSNDIDPEDLATKAKMKPDRMAELMAGKDEPTEEEMKAMMTAAGKMQKGDLPGHEFRGNQWTGEGAGSAERGLRSKMMEAATRTSWGKSNEEVDKDIAETKQHAKAYNDARRERLASESKNTTPIPKDHEYRALGATVNVASARLAADVLAANDDSEIHKGVSRLGQDAVDDFADQRGLPTRNIGETGSAVLNEAKRILKREGLGPKRSRAEKMKKALHDGDEIIEPDDAELGFSANELRQKINDAVVGEYGRGHYVDDIYPESGYAIVSTYSNDCAPAIMGGSSKAHTVRVAYEIGDDGKVTFSEPVEVERKTTLVPVAKSDDGTLVYTAVRQENGSFDLLTLDGEAEALGEVMLAKMGDAVEAAETWDRDDGRKGMTLRLTKSASAEVEEEFEIMVKGDVEGHEFRGNQWTGGGQGGEPPKIKAGVLPAGLKPTLAITDADGIFVETYAGTLAGNRWSKGAREEEVTKALNKKPLPEGMRWEVPAKGSEAWQYVQYSSPKGRGQVADKDGKIINPGLLPLMIEAAEKAGEGQLVAWGKEEAKKAGLIKADSTATCGEAVKSSLLKCQATIADLSGDPVLMRKAAAKGLLYTVVYPNFKDGEQDTQGEVTTPELLEEACHDFALHGEGYNYHHKGTLTKDRAVENYIAPTDFRLGRTDVHVGDWVQCIKLCAETKRRKEAGEFESVSVEGDKVFLD